MGIKVDRSPTQVPTLPKQDDVSTPTATTDQKPAGWNAGATTQKKTTTDVTPMQRLLGLATLDASGKLHPNAGVSLTQFQSAVAGAFGDRSKISKDGTFDTAKTPQAADVRKAFTPALPAATTVAAPVATPQAAPANNADKVAAYKAIIGNTTIDASGTNVVIKNNTLTADQFKAALTTLFGPNAKLTVDGTGTIDDAQVAADFKNLQGSIDGTLHVKDGKVDATLAESMKNLLGPNTLITNNQVAFKDSSFASATLNDELQSKFGPSASLDTMFKASIDQSGVQSAQATAAFKALLGTATLDASGTLKLKQGGNFDQFQAAVSTLFGNGAKVSATGTFDAKSTTLAADFKNAWGSVDASLQLKDGVATTTLSESLKNTLGSNTLVTNNQVQFKDNAFQSASLNDELVSKFGKNASLDTTLKASLDREGVQTATATAALKALVGNTSIDTTGSGFTIKNNQLTDAQFKTAVTTLFGPNAKLDADGTFSWSKDGGIAAEAGAAFNATAKNLKLSADGTLQVKDGKFSGQLEDKLTALLGPNTLVSNNQVVFKDNRFQSAQLEEELKTQFGPRASLDATFKASLDKDGIASANATAAFKALVGNTSVDTTGTGLTIKNNTLTEAQFKAAVQTTFGPNAKLNANGTFSWNKESGVSADAVAAFKGTYDGVSVDANGSISVKAGKLSGQLAENITATLGKNTVVANNQVVFKDNDFQSASLNDSLTTKFGPNASLATTFQASLDQSGIASANATAAFKALLGNTSIDTTGTGLTIKNNTLTDAQFKTALKTVLGPNATLSSDGTFKWNKDSGVSADLKASFKETAKNLTVDAGGTLSIKPGGKVDGTLQENLKAVLGNNTVVANNQVIFKDGTVTATLKDELKHTWGDKGSIDATLDATVKQNGLVDATVSVAAFKRLKDLGKDGGIDITADGSVVIKDNKIDRAEVSALLSVVANKDLNLSGSGKLVFKDGKVDPSFGANLKAAWDNTTLNANGTLTFADGKPQVAGQVGALFGGPSLKGGANIAITGADSGRLDLKLQQLGGKTNIDETGSLVVDHGHITGAGLTTNLVTTGNNPADVSLGGLISVSDHKVEGNLKAQVDAGIISGGIGFGGASQVQVYTPDAKDPNRLAIANKGGVWSERDASFDVNANAGAQATVMLGAVPLTLGFKADADKSREVHTLTIHPSKDDALAQSPLTVIHPPTTVDQVLAMRPYEQYSDKGTQAIGLGGNASVGFGVGPASIKAGGSVYYQITGNLSRDIERLDGNKVRIRFSREDGKTDIKALSASIGLDAGKLAGDNALAQKAAPIVSQMAQAGISATWEKTKEHDTVFDATIDLSTPQGKAAMQHLLNNELAETQKWAGFKDSGVTLNKEIDTNVQANTKKVDMNIGPLNKENLSRWLDKQQTAMSPKDVTFTEAVDQVSSHKAFFPWNEDGRSDTRFVHETKVVSEGKLPDVGDVSTEQTMSVHLPAVQQTRPATLADSAGMLAMRFRISGDHTSQGNAKKSIDSGLAIMKAMGFQKSELGQIDDSRNAVASDELAPKKDAWIFGLGDKRFGKAAVDVEGFLGPKGFNEVFSGRSQQDFKNAYLEASAVGGSIVSTQGTRAAIETTLKAQLLPAKEGGWDVMKDGAKLGSLSNADIEHVRSSIAGLSSNSEGFSATMKLNVGKWAAGAVPDPLVRVTPENWRDANAVLSRADKYSDVMMRAQKLWADNQPPAQNASESKADYDTRLQRWEDSSLFRKPDVFFQQMDGLFSQAIKSDKTPATGLATMGLAGPSHVYGKASVELQPDKLKAMIDKGRSDVQRFAAIDVLAGLGARMDAGGNLVLPSAPENLDVATLAAKQLFGPNVKLARSGSGATFSGLQAGPADTQAALSKFFASVQGSNGAMKLSGLSAADQQAVLEKVFGGTAAVDRGNVVFDNRAFGIVHFGDALSMFKGAFGVGQPPPLFPSLVPIEDVGDKQAYDLSGLVARHNGAESHWGDQFSHLEYLHGANEDLAAKPGTVDPNAWILR